MQNWEYKKLGDVCEFKNGFAFKSNLFKKSGLPILRISNIQNEVMDLSDVVYFEEASYKVDFERYKVFPNEIVIAMSGGTTGKIGRNNTDQVFYLNQRVGKFQPSAILDDSFLYNYLLTKSEESLKIAAGAAQPNLSTEQINNFEIPLPPLDEQKRIVKILDEKFAQLEAVKANAKANLQNAKDLFQSQLTKAFSNTTWEKKRLGEVMTLLSGQDFPPERYNSEQNGIPYITGASNFNDDGTVLINRWTDTPTVIAKRLDVLLVVKGSGYGKTAIADFEEAHIARQIMSLRVLPNIERLFLFYFLNSKFDEIKKKGNGVIPGITRADVLEMTLNLPPLPEQKRIVEQLDSLSEKVRSLEEIYTKQLANCDELKQAFLAKAFAGEL